MSYTDVFGNQTLPPSEFGYSSITLTANLTVVWPYNSDSTSTSISKIVDLTCLAGNTLTLPDAREVSTGEDFLLRNTGANALTVKDAGGVTIATVASGAASYFYLTDNTTQSGTFGVIGFGVGTSSADAASLVGYGVKAIGNTLNQSHPTVPTSSSITIDGDYRSKLVVFTGGAATFTLSSASVLGDDFFVLIRNDGTGTLTIDPTSSETLDGLSTLQVQPSESLILLCTGTEWYSVGYGRSVMYQFTQLTKDLSAGGTITLSAAEASNKLLTFIGNPSATVTVIVPSVVAVYYTYSNLSTAQNITLKTAAGSGTSISQGTRIIAICDGTSVLSAQSAVANSSVSLTDGSVSTPSLFFATSTNTGIYKYGTNGIGFAVNGVDVFHLDGTTITFNNIAVTSSTINSTTIGLATPSSGNFTVLAASGAFSLTGDQVQISEGGTGATTAGTARSNLGISAANTPNTPAGNIAATDVQAAINELDTEKLSTTAAASGYVSKDSSTGSAALPAGTTGQRTGSPSTGATRFNTTTGLPECWNGTTWGPMGGGATGGTGNAAFYENDIAVTADYTITTSKNAMTAGPITINSGVTVTVPSGSVWTVI